MLVSPEKIPNYPTAKYESTEFTGILAVELLNGVTNLLRSKRPLLLSYRVEELGSHRENATVVIPTEDRFSRFYIEIEKNDATYSQALVLAVGIEGLDNQIIAHAIITNEDHPNTSDLLPTSLEIAAKSMANALRERVVREEDMRSIQGERIRVLTTRQAFEDLIQNVEEKHP